MNAPTRIGLAGSSFPWWMHAAYGLVIAVLLVLLWLPREEGAASTSAVPAGDSRPGPAGTVSPEEEDGRKSTRDPRALPAPTTPDPADENLVVVPRPFLESLKLPPIMNRSGQGLDPRTAALLGLDEFQRADLEKALGEALKEIRDLEKSHFEEVNAPNGDQFIRVKAFEEEGRAVRERLLANVRLTLGDDLATLVAAGLDRDFSGFGSEARELSVVWPQGAGADRVYIQTRASSPHARREPSSTGVTLSVEEARSRFGHLLDFASE